MTKEDIIVPRWFLEIIEDTLRIQYNINEPDMKETGESCQDRNIRQCLNGMRKLLSGEELTGMERQEKLQPPLPEGLDEAAEYCADLVCAELYATFNTRYDKKEKCLISKLTSGDVANIKEFGYKLFKAGVMWIIGHGVNGYVVKSFNPASEENGKNLHGITLLYEDNGDNYVVVGDEVTVNIKKK